MLCTTSVYLNINRSLWCYLYSLNQNRNLPHCWSTFDSSLSLYWVRARTAIVVTSPIVIPVSCFFSLGNYNPLLIETVNRLPTSCYHRGSTPLYLWSHPRLSFFWNKLEKLNINFSSVFRRDNPCMSSFFPSFSVCLLSSASQLLPSPLPLSSLTSSPKSRELLKRNNSKTLTRPSLSPSHFELLGMAMQGKPGDPAGAKCKQGLLLLMKPKTSAVRALFLVRSCFRKKFTQTRERAMLKPKPSKKLLHHFIGRWLARLSKEGSWRAATSAAFVNSR